MLDREKIKSRLKAMLTLDNHPGHIAAGFAVGVFISFTPFFGLHTPMALVAAFIFRINKITCLTGAWVNTPLTVLPALGLSYKIGRVLRGLPPKELHFRGEDWHHLLNHHGKSLLLGCSVLGFVSAVAGYFFCYWLVVSFRRKNEAMKEMTREMIEVGEDVEQ